MDARAGSAQGWTYGQPRDNGRKIHPDLAALGRSQREPSKEKDRNADPRLCPSTLRDAGFQILRLPPDS